MAGIGGVVVQFRANADKAIRETNKFVRELKDVDGASKKAGRSLSKGLKAGAIGAAAGLAGLTFAAVDFAKGAYADAQAAAKMQRTLKTIPGITDAAAQSASDFTAKLELLTHVNDDELRPALAKLAVVTKDLGDAQKLTALAADAAVGSGRSFESVATAMAKAAGGNVTALKRLFPQLDAGPDKILTFEEAMDQLRDTYKGAAKDAADNDLFGKLALAWAGLKDALGQAALEPLEEVSEWFSDPENIDAVQDWIDEIGEWSREVGETFRDKLKEFTDYLSSSEGQAALASYGDALENIADGFTAMGSAAGTAAGFVDDLVAAYSGLPGWVKSLQGKAFEFLGNASLPGVINRLRPSKEAPLPRSEPPAPVYKAPKQPGYPSSTPTVVLNYNTNNGTVEDSTALALRINKRINSGR